ncbi:cell wall-binding repeat-containing protein [Clostridium thailandense]|uniref:cell wall-binding repeat-containing protein n=1 Tax=Clostridium thailandense TaxID=2794346 RepID=UPI003989A825
MKKIFSKVILFLFMVSITLSNISNVHADETISRSRIFGNDRIETSIKISQNGWQNGTDTVVIAQGYGYADALCAAPLAKKYNAPILLSDKNGLSDETINELKRLKVKKAFIIGGTGSLSENVENQLKSLEISHIERLWGKDRYETSLKIAESLGEVASVVVTSGNGYADSLSIAPIAAQKGIPILLSDKNNLTDGVKDYIKDKNIKNSYIIGGTGVISEKIQSDLPNPKRLSGQDRFETNLAIINEFQNDLKFEKVFMAEGDGTTGNEFADALAGSVLAAQNSAPLVLVYKTIPSKTAEFIKTKMSNKTELVALGGEAVVADSILNGLIDLFNGKTVPTSTATTTTTTGGTSSGGSSGSSSGGSSSDKTFTMTITKNNQSSTIKSFTMTIDKDKTNENAMEYLKSVCKVTELQGAGFINGIDGLLNVFLKDLPIKDREAGYYGIDWFVYLNGKITSVGAPGVYPKEGDKLNFDYHEWDWHALVSPDYNGTIPLTLEDVPSSVKSGDSMKLRVTCVYRGVYNVAVKVDGKQVATTDIDGYATIAINEAGTHTITVEKDGGSKSKTVTVTSSGGSEDTDDLELKSDGQTYDGSVSGNESEIGGNVTISANNVSLKNVKVDGELIIDPGTDGNSDITNVTASKIVVKSGGVHSINFANVKSDLVQVSSISNVRIEVKGETEIKNTQVSNSCILDSTDSTGTFGQVTVQNDDKNDCGTLELRGNFQDNIEVHSSVKLLASTNNPIPEVKVNSESKPNVAVQGKFEKISVEKEATIEANSAQISKISADADVTIKFNDNTSAVGSIEKAKDANVDCKDKDGKDITTIPTEEKQTTSVTGITLDKTSSSLEVKDTLHLTATIQPDNATNKSVTWTSSDTSIATVDANGKITAVKEGNATIVATTADGQKTASCIVTVVAAGKNEGIKVSLDVVGYKGTILTEDSLDAKEGDSVYDLLKSTLDSKGISFVNKGSSSQVYISKINGMSEFDRGKWSGWKYNVNGTFPNVGCGDYHVKNGDVIHWIYVTGIWDEAAFRDVDSITLDKTQLNLNSGDTANIKAAVNPANATDKDIIWTSSDSTVASVDSNGKITAIKAGTAVITATSIDSSKGFIINYTANPVVCNVTVVGSSTEPTNPTDPTTDTTLVNITGAVTLNIIQTKDNTIKLQGNSKNNSDLIAITLYDEKGNLKYINQTTGAMDATTILDVGKYHGYIKASSVNIMDINEFEVK